MSATPSSGRKKTKSGLKLFKSGSLRLALISIILLAAVIAAVVIFSGNKPKPPAAQADTACGPYRTDRVIHINGRAFDAEVASGAAAAQKGLGGRPCILSNQAMLFAFQRPGQYSFWMKGMKFPIDMIWIGPDYKVVYVAADVPSSSYPETFVNQKDQPAQYVLEVKANTSKNLGIKPGTLSQISNYSN